MDINDCNPAPFVTCHANRKNNKTYYVLIRDLPELGSDIKYVLYQDSGGALYVREKTDFKTNFRQLDIDARPKIPARNINEISNIIASPVSANSGNAVDSMIVVYDQVVDASKVCSQRERMMYVFYDPYTNTLWTAEAKTPRMHVRHEVLKKSIQQLCIIQDPNKLPLFAQTSACKHVLGYNNTQTPIYHNTTIRACSNPITLFNECPICNSKLAVKYMDSTQDSIVFRRIWNKNEYLLTTGEKTEPEQVKCREGWTVDETSTKSVWRGK